MKGTMRDADDGSRNLVTGFTRGALAGVAANWIMGQVTSYLYQHESEEARSAEQEARGGKMAYGVAAEKVAEAVGQDLSEEDRNIAGRKNSLYVRSSRHRSGRWIDRRPGVRNARKEVA